MNFWRENKPYLSFSDFFKTEAINLKKLASIFQDAIHFHPGHLQPRTLKFTLKSTSRIILNKPGPIFWFYTDVNMSFGFLK